MTTFSPVAPDSAPAGPDRPSKDRSSKGRSSKDRPLVVGIGGSAGAVTALQHFFDALPKGDSQEGEAQEENLQEGEEGREGKVPDLGLTFVVVIHLAPEKRSELAEILQSKTSLPVTQVTEATRIEENHVYVTAPGRTLLFEGRTLVPHRLEEGEERRFPIDQFFRSLARAPVEPIGAVLSGAGTDGSVGLRALKEAGGLTAAQDPSEARHDSMPRAAIEASRVDLVLPVAELARRLSKQPRVLDHLPLLGEPEKAIEEEGEELEEILRGIFEEVRSRTGHDFRQYKRSTMLRRIRRRLQVHELHSLPDYLSYLKEHPGEASALLKDCLISVTSFFRDREAFEALREKAIPEILSSKGPGDQVRAWAVGCATGEEAYTLAMLLLEQADSHNVAPDQIQVFATDLDEEALATARRGRYPEAIAADVPERYLERFFYKDGEEQVVQEAVRDRVLLTTHNLISDPPFSKLDLISCRNLLIYLQRELQEKVFDLFSYALDEEGFLFLGSSESADQAEKHFRAQNKSFRLYRRRKGPAVVPEMPSGPLAPQATAPQATAPQVPKTPETTLLDGGERGVGEEDSEEGQGSQRISSQRFSSQGRSPGLSSKAAVHRRLLEAYAPPSAVVGEDFRFVHLSRGAGRFLRHPGGTPNQNIVDLVRPELKMKLRSALREAFAEGKATKTRPTGVKFDGETRPVRLIVRPAREATGGALEVEGMALVLFEEVGDAETEDALTEEGAPEMEMTEGESEEDLPMRETPDKDARVAQLEAELKQTKEELRATIEEHEASKQEMQAANEELRSMNEEYRSTAEELETSKEELQSVNEELKSVNRELEEKVQQLKAANADLESLMAATNIGTLFLGEGLQIQRFTPRIEELFNIRAADEGRPVGDLTHHLGYDHLVDDAQRVLEEETSVEREAQSEDGEWFLVRHHPHRSAQGEVNGVVVTFVEITRRKKAEEELRSTNESLQRRTRQVQNLTEALTTAEEEERKRLSEVLHDSLQQTLFAAKMKIESLKDQAGNEQERKSAETARELIEEGIETARSLSRELDPPVGKESLRGTFEWLAGQMEESYDLTVQVKAEDSAEAESAKAQSTKAEATDQSLQSLVFRLTKELLFNVVKHAETGEAFLYLKEEGGQLQVVVEDEGEGFDPELLEEEEGGGHGLVSVRERIEMIGGTFEVESASGEGTRTTITVPWQTNGIEEES